MAPRTLLIGPVSAALALFCVTAQSTTLSLNVSNPYCLTSQPERNRCTINVRSISAVASDSSLSRIEVAIDGKVRLVETTFFENSTYFNRTMVPDGLSVLCGFEGQGGATGFGLIHAVGISAFVSGSSPIVDVANVTCPPASDHIFGDGFEPGGAG
ncbi:MAG: hypothetical protein R3F08_01760 [Dokdonella sp.]|nr:hypothetical protein [Dokdonella sp.]